MKKYLIMFLFLCTLSVSAQDVVVTRPKKQQATTTKPKQNRSQSTQSTKPKQNSTQSTPSTEPKQNSTQSTSSTEPKQNSSQSTPSTESKQNSTQSTSSTEPKQNSTQSTQSTEPNSSSQQIVSKTFTANGVSFDMMMVKAGTFTMGATSEMKDPWDDERPTHQVTLSNDYYIGKTEVTQALWKAVMGNNPSDFNGDNLPVESVSWNDCQKFISKLNSMTGQNFRLPTEAEWEFAARGGNNSNHYQYSGSNNLGDVAWYEGNSGGKTHTVATKQPNELGIYDMSGNVWEWCSDWYGDYRSSYQTNPTGPNNGSNRVFRGGGWRYDARHCRSSYRFNFTPDFSFNFLGLRLVLVS